jgi:two-component system LytT family response regulator
MTKAVRAYLLDDEELALKRLGRLLEEDGRLEIVGSNSDAVAAVTEIRQLQPDVLFLDIEMPAMTGFDLLRVLDPQPVVIFTTAYSQYALQAFEVNSIDYLLKPVEQQQLDRALAKLERIFQGTDPKPDVTSLLAQLTAALQGGKAPDYPQRLASRTGDRVEFIDLDRVTHIFAKDKLTYAATPARNYCLDATIAELEGKLDPKRFVRIHRSTIVNTAFVHEMYTWFAGRMLVRLRDEKKTELTVARDRVRALKDQLGI